MIELLMVLFIIGILTVIAVPTYVSQAGRAKMAEAAVLAAPIRRQVDVFWNATGKFPNNNAEAGAAAPAEHAGEYVGSIEVVEGGAIEVHMSDPIFDNGHIVFTPTAGVAGQALIWQCSSPNIAPRLLPKDCR